MAYNFSPRRCQANDETRLTEPIRSVSDLARILGPTQFKVAKLVPTGLSNKQIADRLGTTEQVVKNYLRTSYAITGCDNRMGLTRWLVSLGVVQIDHIPDWRLLTPLQLKIAKLTGQGLEHSEIAKQVGLHYKTVKHHMTRISALLGLNRIALVAAISSQGDIDHVQPSDYIDRQKYRNRLAFSQASESMVGA